MTAYSCCRPETSLAGWKSETSPPRHKKPTEYHANALCYSSVHSQSHSRKIRGLNPQNVSQGLWLRCSFSKNVEEDDRDMLLAADAIDMRSCRGEWYYPKAWIIILALAWTIAIAPIAPVIALQQIKIDLFCTERGDADTFTEPTPASVRLAAIDHVDDLPQRYCNDSAITISVIAALRDRRDESTLLRITELS